MFKNLILKRLLISVTIFSILFCKTAFSISISTSDTSNKPAVNSAPDILVKLPAQFPVSTSVNIPFEVYDSNADTYTVTAKFDDTDLTLTKISNNNYNVAIPAASMIEGSHTLIITAIDLWGGDYGTSIYKKTINVSGTAHNRVTIAPSDYYLCLWS